MTLPFPHDDSHASSARSVPSPSHGVSPRRRGALGYGVVFGFVFGVGLGFVPGGGCFPGTPRAGADEPAPGLPMPGSPAPGSPGSAAEPTALSRLTDDERAFLHRRMPDFDRRDDATQEKIARNVLRLRTLSPEERERLLSRLRRVEESGGPGAEQADDRLRRLQDIGKAPWLAGARHIRAASSLVFRALPPTARAFVIPGTGTDSLGAAERLSLDVCVAMAWKRRALDGLVAQPPLDAEPTAGSAAPASSVGAFVAARERVRSSGGVQAPEGERRRFALAVLEDRVTAARRLAEEDARPVVGPRPVDSPGDAPGESSGNSPGDGAPSDSPSPFRAWHESPGVARFARRLGEAFPGVAERVASDLARAIEGGRSGLRAFCDAAAPERATPRDRVLVELVFGLERARLLLSGEVLAKALEFQVSLLRELKVSDADLASFQGSTDEKARLLVLAGLRRRVGGWERGPHGEALFPKADRWGGGRRGGRSDGGSDR